MFGGQKGREGIVAVAVAVAGVCWLRLETNYIGPCSNWDSRDGLHMP